jgi:(R,R)-butanediol dehydrogenase / meso-butanediol dehydrogenase / diacetyl reductase
VTSADASADVTESAGARSTIAAVLYGPGDLRVEERTVRSPGPGEALVRVAVCGVCGSDATEYARGPVLTVLPVTLGHEFAGTVEAVGADVDLAIGANVVCGAGISCGRCKPCLSGRTNLCRSYRTAGLQVDGGLAGYVTVPAATLIDVGELDGIAADRLSSDTLGLAQPLSLAVHAVARSGLRAGQDAVVVGIGGIGAFIVHAAAATGARVLAVDRSADRLDLARALGATEVLDTGVSIRDGLDQLGWEADVLFEVSGSTAGWEQVLAAADPGATIVPVGIQRGDVPVPLGSWTLREYTIVGTVAHALAADMPRAVGLLAARADWSDIAADVLPLSEVVEGGLQPILDGASRQVKTLIDPWITEPRRAAHGRSQP